MNVCAYENGSIVVPNNQQKLLATKQKKKIVYIPWYEIKNIMRTYITMYYIYLWVNIHYFFNIQQIF